jgi:cytochrome c
VTPPSLARAHQEQEMQPQQNQAPQSMGQGQMMGQGMMGQEDQMMPGMNRLMMPQMDPARGRKLFASKGCVACHAVNGVGGHDATPLDAHTMDGMMSPFDFAAKMWRMAPAMIYAQEEALGEQILFTGDEIADIIAFVHHDEEQHKFSEGDIPPKIRGWMSHAHGEPGGGGEAHGEELGHGHDAGDEHPE